MQQSAQDYQQERLLPIAHYLALTNLDESEAVAKILEGTLIGKINNTGVYIEEVCLYVAFADWIEEELTYILAENNRLNAIALFKKVKRRLPAFYDKYRNTMNENDKELIKQNVLTLVLAACKKLTNTNITPEELMEAINGPWPDLVWVFRVIYFLILVEWVLDANG